MLRCAVLALAMAGPAAAQAHIVAMQGGATCAQWAQQRPKNAAVAEAWLLGYLSGIAQEADIDVLKSVGRETVFRWMDDYCRQNPKKDLALGGFMYMGTLRVNLKPSK